MIAFSLLFFPSFPLSPSSLYANGYECTWRDGHHFVRHLRYIRQWVRGWHRAERQREGGVWGDACTIRISHTFSMAGLIFGKQWARHMGEGCMVQRRACVTLAMESNGINNAIKLNSHVSLWIKWSMAGVHRYAHPPTPLLTASSSVWKQPCVAIPSVSCVPAPLISVVHTLCPSVRPPTLIPIPYHWHPILSIPLILPRPWPSPWQHCHLWPRRRSPFSSRLPMCLTTGSSASSQSVSEISQPAV